MPTAPRNQVPDEHFNQLLTYQNNSCAICNKIFITDTMTQAKLAFYNIHELDHRLPQVDHCRHTHRVRGILCRKCNNLIRNYSAEEFKQRYQQKWQALKLLITTPNEHLKKEQIAALTKRANTIIRAFRYITDPPAQHLEIFHYITIIDERYYDKHYRPKGSKQNYIPNYDLQKWSE